MGDEILSKTTGEKKGGSRFGFLGFFAKVEKRGDDGFGDKNACDNCYINIVACDFVNGDETDDKINNKKNCGGIYFGAENVRKCDVVGFSTASLTKSMMVKTGKKSGI